LVHDDLAVRPGTDSDSDSDSDSIVNVVRMALTAGWVVGPTLGAWLAAGAGLRVMLAVTAVCTAAQLLTISRRRDHPTAPRSSVGLQLEGGRAETHMDVADAVRTAPSDKATGMWPLLIFTGLYVLVYAREPIKFGFLPIYMRDDLRFGAGPSGAVIGIQPLVELLILHFTIMLARRIGAVPLMAAGALLGVGANWCFATTGTAAAPSRTPHCERLRWPESGWQRVTLGVIRWRLCCVWGR
jgi:SET family sugar efflux transporter-like MFS transporter